MQRRMKFVVLVLVVIVACSVGTRGMAGIIFRSPEVDVPVSLAKGTTARTKEFGSKKRDYYLISVVAQRRHPDDGQACMMGIEMGPLSSYACGQKPLLQAAWHVLDGDKIIAGGTVQEKGGGGVTSRTLERYLGHFWGEAGHKYVLEITFIGDGGPLNSTTPHLVVEIKKNSD
jgi:hypothetical protein